MITLPLGGIDDLVSNNIVNIPDRVNLLDILPKVVAPSSDPLESCFLLPRPLTPDPEYIVKPLLGANTITNLDISNNELLSNSHESSPTQEIVQDRILSPQATPASSQATVALPSLSENNEAYKVEVTSKKINITNGSPPFPRRDKILETYLIAQNF